MYVGHLPYSARERDIERFFRGFGRLREVNLKNGFCFVVSRECIAEEICIFVARRNLRILEMRTMLFMR